MNGIPPPAHQNIRATALKVQHVTQNISEMKFLIRNNFLGQAEERLAIASVPIVKRDACSSSSSRHLCRKPPGISHPEFPP